MSSAPRPLAYSTLNFRGVPAAIPLIWISWGIVMMSMYVLLSRDFTARDRQVINVIAAYIALFGNIGLHIDFVAASKD